MPVPSFAGSMRKLKPREEMTCPESSASDSKSEALGLLPLNPWPLLLGRSSLVLVPRWSPRVCGQGRCRRERGTQAPFLCRSSSTAGCWCCSSHRGVSSERHPRADWKADEPFPDPEDSSPATGSESGSSLQKHPSSKSPTLGPAKKQPVFPALGVTNPSLLQVSVL